MATMIRTIFRWIVRGVSTVAIVLFVALLGYVFMHYAFGLQVVLTGGGSPRLRFPASADEQARLIEAHREAQRQAAPATAPASAGAPATPPIDVPASPAPAAASGTIDWVGFRGPNRDGIYSERPILTTWPADGLRPLWKQPIGGGYASFAIARGRAFTIEQRGGKEFASAYDLRSGRELWTTNWEGFFQEYMGGDGPRATPTWSDGVVYVLGAEGEFRALDDASGRTIWRTNILADAEASNLQWGMSASPLVVDDTVIVMPGGTNGRSVIAYDRVSGKRAWSALDDRASYAAPMLATVAGVRQLVVLTGTRLVGVELPGGRLLWEYPWYTNPEVNAAQPIQTADNRFFVSSGYGTGAAVVELTRANDRFTVREVWRHARFKNRFNSSVLHDGHIYGFDESIFACIDAATGEQMWKGGRYGYGQVLLASGHLIVLTEEGDLVLLRATPARHEEVARFSAIDGKTWNVPAISDGILLIRNLAEMAAFDLRVR
jgi:outer membrane protein assembly factor BamB